jgi:crossover junction endodeoxyribonuclease RuvC
LSGALAIVDEQQILFVDDLPVHLIRIGKKDRTELDLPSLRLLLSSHSVDHVIIERVAARPGQGTVSMFRFGYSAGEVYGLVVGLALACSFILPQAWQRSAGCGPSPDAARQRAAQLYPGIADKLGRKRDAGRADAILIARSGLMTLRPAQSQVAQ